MLFSLLWPDVSCINLLCSTFRSSVCALRPSSALSVCPSPLRALLQVFRLPCLVHLPLTSSSSFDPFRPSAPSGLQLSSLHHRYAPPPLLDPAPSVLLARSVLPHRLLHFFLKQSLLVTFSQLLLFRQQVPSSLYLVSVGQYLFTVFLFTLNYPPFQSESCLLLKRGGTPPFSFTHMHWLCSSPTMVILTLFILFCPPFSALNSRCQY